jgi:hypothetical protein
MDLTQYLKTRARARRVAAEGADVMVTQSQGGARGSECFQIRWLKSAVRLERRDEEGNEGLRSIDTVPTVSAIVRAPRDASFDVLGFCGGIRASVSVLRSSKSTLTRLRTRYEPSTDPFASVRYRPVTAVVLWRAGED